MTKENKILLLIIAIALISAFIYFVEFKKQNPNSTEKFSDNGNISAEEIASYLSGVVKVVCDSAMGTGSLWHNNTLGYFVLTNNHVVGDDKGVCLLKVEKNDSSNTLYGESYQMDLNTKIRWNPNSDIAAAKMIVNPQVELWLSQAKKDSAEYKSLSESVGVPIEQLNYNISILQKCPNDISVGSPVIVVGYPAFGEKVTPYTDKGKTYGLYDSFRTVTNGIISAYDNSVTKPVGDLPFSNYFVSAKIDSGNSGGVAFSKSGGNLCVLGVPTWISVGNYETQGLVQNINNIFSK